MGFSTFIAAALLALLCFAVQDRLLTEMPAEFYIDGIYPQAGFVLAVLIAAWLSALVLHRPAIWLTLGSLLLLVAIAWTLLWQQLPDWLADVDEFQSSAWYALIGFALWIITLRIFGFVARDAGFGRRVAASLLCWSLLAWPWYERQQAWFWYPIADQTDRPDNAPTAKPVESQPAPDFNPEVVMTQQAALVDRALQAITTQAPGKTDVYTLGFAGDGSEQVFRNEVDFFGKLMAGRFSAKGHSLSLINSPDTVTKTPLASLSNLQSMLSGLAQRMDTEQDILVLFLTSHGSESHKLLVDLDPLPLNQINPGALRGALDDSGIRWRVVIISACYSGGFIDALSDPRTLVITAARSDRTSFGCGNDAEITWFGKAFLAQALNQTQDFEQAFAIASKQIREWELAEGNTPSVPQMVAGALIEEKLREWRENLPPSDPVVFISNKKPTPKPLDGQAAK